MSICSSGHFLHLFFSPPVSDRVDREFREKEKILSDLEKAEKLKNQLATEVDEHHSAIEYKNNLNLRYIASQQSEMLSGTCA